MATPLATKATLSETKFLVLSGDGKPSAEWSQKLGEAGWSYKAARNTGVTGSWIAQDTADARQVAEAYVAYLAAARKPAKPRRSKQVLTPQAPGTVAQVAPAPAAPADSLEARITAAVTAALSAALAVK